MQRVAFGPASGRVTAVLGEWCSPLVFIDNKSARLSHGGDYAEYERWGHGGDYAEYAKCTASGGGSESGDAAEPNGRTRSIGRPMGGMASAAAERFIMIPEALAKCSSERARRALSGVRASERAALCASGECAEARE